MLDLSSLQYNSEYPGLMSILITILSSMLLGVLIAFTYDKTSREVNRPDHFLQAMILVTIVAATVIQAIGDSVARGLGMIGALSIIRFRTTVKDSRNIVFMFGAIAVGIACGVFGLTIAFVGTIGFCVTAFLLRFLSFSPKDDFYGKLKVEIDTNIINLDNLNSIIVRYSKKHMLLKSQMNLDKGSNIVSYSYDLKLKKSLSEADLIDELTALKGVNVKRFGMEKNLSDNI